MGKPKVKFYVVWEGRERGVFLTWEECKAHTHKYPAPKYKSFTSLVEAQRAFFEGPDEYWGINEDDTPITPEERLLLGEPIVDSIAVDAAWNTITRVVEYKGVFTRDRKIIFQNGPFSDGTINIGEFIAIVHALAHCKKFNICLPIYSDSSVAIGWVKSKKANTNHERSKHNEELFELLLRAEKWLHQNNYENKLLKWETKAWGENPADFGRK
jgi:ribonuclease HI